MEACLLFNTPILSFHFTFSSLDARCRTVYVQKDMILVNFVKDSKLSMTHCPNLYIHLLLFLWHSRLYTRPSTKKWIFLDKSPNNSVFSQLLNVLKQQCKVTGPKNTYPVKILHTVYKNTTVKIFDIVPKHGCVWSYMWGQRSRRQHAHS